MATGDQQITKSSQAWSESPYRFTDPVRLFKANDPYYWEVDNIPLQQLEENVLWLKDQIATSTFVSGVGRSDIAELRPFANGSSRTVYVQPGRYTARINDAYNKGIGTRTLAKRAILSNADREAHTFTYSDAEIDAFLGDATETVFLNNGLYDHLQHHNSEATTPNGFLLDWRHGYTYFTQNNKGINEVMNLPKNKLALWKPSSSFPSQTGTLSVIDLQQAATEFTRIYGAAVRTSVVNVPEQLEINIPDFDVDDHRRGTTAQPAVRVDMLFLYSHPIDADSTTIASPNGSEPTQIFAPRLGLLKGAGVVAVSAVSEQISTSLEGVSGYVGSTEWNANSADPTFRLDAGEAVDENGNYLINAPAADQLQTAAGLNNVYGSFPSPDDVMNLAPMFAEQVEDGDNQYNLIGQSILPLAYVFVKRNKALIEPGDVVDIRPFFRTTELAYNERAGVAAASPPLSFANPAVGKQELRDVAYKAKRDMQQQMDPVRSDVNFLLGNGQVLSKGIIFGGTKWGVEGSLAAYMREAGLFPTLTEADTLAGLKEFGHVPIGIDELPLYPGWDINHDYFDQAPGGATGTLRNDRLHSAVVWGDDMGFDRVTPEAQFPQGMYEFIQDKDPYASDGLENYLGKARTGTGVGGGQKLYVYTYGSLFVKKDIDFPAGFLDGFTDYEVDANLHGCALGTNPTNTGYLESVGMQFTGITVQKRGKKGITIIVSLGHPSGDEGNLYLGKALEGEWDRPAKYLTDWPNVATLPLWQYMRTFPGFSRVMPLSSEMVTLGSSTRTISQTDREWDTSQGYRSVNQVIRENGTIASPRLSSFIPSICTYPTVEFTITGYTNNAQVNLYYSNNPAQGSNTSLNS